MKAELDKEIDALLRRNARAAGRVARGDGGAAPQAPAHLDADELSAFAENALPEAARLSAVSHLADCDECRGLVVTLSSAADAAGELEKRAAVPASAAASAPAGGWFAALFTPRVLRFVAPVLALCLAAAVALLVLRTNRPSGSQVALSEREPNTASPKVSHGVVNMGANANASLPSETPADPAAQAENADPSTQQVATDTSASAPAAPVNETPDGSVEAERQELAQAPREAATEERVAAPPPPMPVAAGTAGVGAASTAQPPPASASREEAKAKKEDQPRADDEAAGGARKAPAERRADLADNQQTPDGSRNKSADSALEAGRGATASPARPEPIRRNRSMGGPAARRGEGEEARDRDAAESGGETRSAAGHRFRREGGAWVDVNYRSTMSMTGVRRGTEAFRALVADIPELGRVAEQLGGVVITVVRGRAYRIQ